MNVYGDADVPVG